MARERHWLRRDISSDSAIRSASTESQTEARPDAALGFLARERVASYVQEQSGLGLCGAGTSCPGG